jgi:hypothetical protein
MAKETIIDECLVVAIVIFLLACIVSYASVRSLKKGDYYERIAEFIFLGGLILLGTCAVGVGVELLH